jgi:hypothetical protein
LRQIERLMKRKLEVDGDEPHWINDSAPSANGASSGGNRNRGRRGPGNVPRGASGGKRPRRRTNRSERPAAARSGGSTNGGSTGEAAAAPSQPSNRPSRPKKRRILARL